jgi:hypothetical protein
VSSSGQLSGLQIAEGSEIDLASLETEFKCGISEVNRLLSSASENKRPLDSFRVQLRADSRPVEEMVSASLRSAIDLGHALRIPA